MSVSPVIDSSGGSWLKSNGGSAGAAAGGADDDGAAADACSAGPSSGCASAGADARLRRDQRSRNVSRSFILVLSEQAFVAPALPDRRGRAAACRLAGPRDVAQRT